MIDAIQNYDFPLSIIRGCDYGDAAVIKLITHRDDQFDLDLVTEQIEFFEQAPCLILVHEFITNNRDKLNALMYLEKTVMIIKTVFVMDRKIAMLCRLKWNSEVVQEGRLIVKKKP